ncbi:acyl-CoA dehydrogenase family protein [Rhodococcus sp. NPDC059968]|uniref:acyl-CoA dehydrogenase family protein n=1 Tax=Rhodococcus sp. NPDC059968 TaxID=3347017 RepID=UPI00366CCB40
MSTLVESVLELFTESVPPEPDEITAERHRVRTFLEQATHSGLMISECDSWLSGHSAAFSAELGRQGWIGMTWPEQYGGRATSAPARFAVIEELLAAGAPVAAHWFSDRQIGPSLLRHGSEAQREFFLPAMARGELFFCIGMSEPESGSDLGSVRSRASQTAGGWLVNGSKIWTSHADKAHYMLALVRTGRVEERAAEALTQVIIDMRQPGITVRPIRTLDGREHFCEVIFDDVFVPDDNVLGRVDGGWQQVMGELGFERSGPERFLSTFPMFAALASDNGEPNQARDEDLGSVIARLSVLRAMSTRINHHLDGDDAPGVAAAIVKDLGTTLENDTIDITRRWMDSIADPQRASDVSRWFTQAQTHAPGFTLRGGTNEIMRGIIARALEVS